MVLAGSIFHRQKLLHAGVGDGYPSSPSGSAIGRNDNDWRTRLKAERSRGHFADVKGKVFPYSLPSVGSGADPGVQAFSPQVT